VSYIAKAFLDGTASYAAMAFLATEPLSRTEYPYSTSLKAKRKAAVITLCVTLGPIPEKKQVS
jgi:hypothetical protein